MDTATVHTMIDAVSAHFDTVARYYRIKRDILGVEKLYHYDRYAPLFPDESLVTWDEARGHGGRMRTPPSRLRWAR